MHKWFVSAEFNETSKQAADFIASEIASCIEKNGVCHVILPGGNTPAKCLHYLLEHALSWERVHWYLGDERCYPAGHADRNDVMLEKNLWSHMSEPNVHRIPAELGAEEAASAYCKIISQVENFDIAFLGMGEDGHTASLFPGNEALQDHRSVVPVYNAPKAPPERVSLSVDTFKKAACRVVLVSGSEKSAVISQVKEGEVFPINCIGDINWFVDEAAVSG